MTPPPSSAALAARATPAVHPRRVPLAPVRRPRRISGPLPRPAGAPPAPARGRVGAASTRGATSAAPARSLLDSRAIDRLIHGRAWIGVIAFALIGIVTMQLGLLKLNAGSGRALEHEAALQRENSALSVENSEIAAGDTVELQAAHMGMRLIPAGTLRFLSAQGSAGDVGRALTALNARASGLTQSSAASSTGAASSTEAESSAQTSAAGSSESVPSVGSSPGTSTNTAETVPASGTSASSAGASAAGAEGTGENPASAPVASTPATGATPSTPATPTTTTPPSGEAGGASASPGG
jgi:hypothetical protein